MIWWPETESNYRDQLVAEHLGADSRSPCVGILSGRLPTPDYTRRVGGLAGAESGVSAGGVKEWIGT